jgi:collagen type IV alpha-3-binding protein
MDTQFGCRGSIALKQSTVVAHDLDECRFDIRVNDCVWYLRAHDTNERNHWIYTLEEHRKYLSDTLSVTNGTSSTTVLKKHPSLLSLNSLGCVSTTSHNKHITQQDLKEKLAEIETYKDILNKQIETLQVYFDACANSVTEGFEPYNNTAYDSDLDDDTANELLDTPNNISIKIDRTRMEDHAAMTVDFKGEALTFKATAMAIITNLTYSIDMMQHVEDNWRKKYEKEIEKRMRLDDKYKKTLKQKNDEIVYLTNSHLNSVQNASCMNTPDFEEGPHSSFKEEQFFDAIDNTLDNFEIEDKRRSESKKSLDNFASMKVDKPSEKVKHRLNDDIEKIVQYHLKFDRQEMTDIWELFASDGEMKLYRREIEENGIVLDPLKAVHTVRGVTGHEVCHYFWDPKYRLEWETTLDSTRVIEVIDESTLVFHQVHKRVWPAAQRDACFWSNLRSVQNEEDDEQPPDWIVCNYSTDHELAPAKSPFVRAIADIAMTCRTLIVNPPRDKTDINRSHLMCKISYVAQINPGGWVPAAGLRTIFKREYPRFLKRFTGYVIEQTAKKPILF